MEVAQGVRLGIEYGPQSPFDAGVPDTVPADAAPSDKVPPDKVPP